MRLLRPLSHPLLGLGLVLVIGLLSLPLTAYAVSYFITGSFQPSGTGGNTVTASGQLDFTGSLATDGTFALISAQVPSFSLTFECIKISSDDCFTSPIVFALGDLEFGIGDLQYKASANELVEIDLTVGNAKPRAVIGNTDGSTTDDALVLIVAGSVSCGSSSCEGTYTLTTDPIPEPSTMLLLGSGLAGLFAWRMRKAKVLINPKN